SPVAQMSACKGTTAPVNAGPAVRRISGSAHMLTMMLTGKAAAQRSVVVFANVRLTVDRSTWPERLMAGNVTETIIRGTICSGCKGLAATLNNPTTAGDR